MDIFESFKQVKILPLEINGLDISITNSVLLIFLAVAVIVLFFYCVSRRLKPVPSYSQSIAEYIVQFIRAEMLSPLKEEGETWLPFVVSLFCFVLACNLLGLVPGFLPPTSNINVTASLAVIVFLVVQAAGVARQGPLGYIKSIVPPGLPPVIAALLFPVEVIAQLARPFSLAIRLFANMFAGHVIIAIFIGLIFFFRSYLVAPFPVIGSAMILAFEVFVSFIQAFVFAFLSSSYITDALQTEH